MTALGDRVKDELTGFTGIVIVRSEHLQGCLQVAVKPETLDKDGVPKKTQWFDEPQLEIVEKGVIKSQGQKLVDTKPVSASGGPRETPPDRH